MRIILKWILQNRTPWSGGYHHCYVFGKYRVHVWVRTPITLSSYQSLQTNCRMVTSFIKIHVLPYPFLINCSLLILSPYAVQLFISHLMPCNCLSVTLCRTTVYQSPYAVQLFISHRMPCNCLSVTLCRATVYQSPYAVQLFISHPMPCNLRNWSCLEITDKENTRGPELDSSGSRYGPEADSSGCSYESQEST